LLVLIRGSLDGVLALVRHFPLPDAQNDDNGRMINILLSYVGWNIIIYFKGVVVLEGLCAKEK